MASLLFICLIVAAFTEVFYVIYDSCRHKTIERRLEALLKKNEADLKATVEDLQFKSVAQSSSEKRVPPCVDAITLINYVNRQLHILDDNRHTVEYKVVETTEAKSTKRFISRVFSTDGFKKFLTAHSNTSFNI
jgi:hypothetical protein